MGHVIGVDVGGTFTDAVLVRADGGLVASKTPSTPPNYDEGVLNAVDLLAKETGIDRRELLGDTDYIAHGTTSSLNALVTGQVPDVGFITTKGHRDSIYIMNVEGRYLGRPQHELQDIMRHRKPRNIVRRKLAREATERVGPAGNGLVKLYEEEERQIVRQRMVYAGVHIARS